ncbi:MAG: Asp-tRNA(Asn)/Glu-tRNA(Gln) amidotransferase subunit GatB, partial [Bacteroidota bacterium]
MGDGIEQYEVVVGLEIHIQLNTATKAFCGDPNRFGAAPNTLTSAISLGHPGTLPRANAKQVEYAAKLGLALGCSINQQSYFDRKNYFYPDLPKGYQVTQDNAPICLGGSIDIEVNGQTKTIRLTRIHMEEDAGKSIHDISDKATMIDLNRAGVPLLEVVTEPDLRSGEEAYALLNEFRKLVRYLGISDGNLEEGSVRCDCNISIRPFGQETYGTRCEIKNVNSMRNAQKAIEYESKRQIRLIESGVAIEQQTRAFNAVKSDTETILRTKEDAHDYRYFPEPDLPIIHISDEQLSTWKTEQPALPWELEAKLINQHQLSRKEAKTLTKLGSSVRVLASFRL